MQLAARSYLAAGVALVGASAIAVSPMAPSVPEVHVPVALTAAVDNPLTVFEPVATATETLFKNIIERQTTDPAPIAKQLVENAIAGGQVFASDPLWGTAQALAHIVVAAQEFGPNLAALGETTSSSAAVLSEALSGLIAGLPAGLQAAGAEIAAGNASGALDAIVIGGMQPVINILLFAVTPEINAIGHVLNVPQPIIDATTEAAFGAVIGLAASTIGTGADLDGVPQGVVKQFIKGAQNVANAVTSGDPVNVVNAVQHGIADFAESVVYQTDQTITMGNYIEDTYANALKQLKPVKTTPEPLPLAAATTAAAAPAIEAKALVTEAPEVAPVANADNASDSVAAPAADASDAEAEAKPASKVTTKASPKATKGQAKANSAKAVRDQVKSTVKKLTDGLKKDKPSIPKKAESSNDSAKGADSK